MKGGSRFGFRLTCTSALLLRTWNSRILMTAALNSTYRVCSLYGIQIRIVCWKAHVAWRGCCTRQNVAGCFKLWSAKQWDWFVQGFRIGCSGALLTNVQAPTYAADIKTPSITPAGPSWKSDDFSRQKKRKASIVMYQDRQTTSPHQDRPKHGSLRILFFLGLSISNWAAYIERTKPTRNLLSMLMTI